MKSTKFIFLVTGLLAFAAGGSAYFFAESAFSDHTHPAIEALLATPNSIEQVRLYPQIAGQNLVTALDFLNLSSIPTQLNSKEIEVNGDTLDTYSMKNRTQTFNLEWYSEPVGGKKTLKSATLRGADGQMLTRQIVFRNDRTRVMSGELLSNGNYQTSTYYDDGISLASVSIVGTGPSTWDDSPQLLSETDWRRTGEISRSDVLNSDASRTIKLFDNDGILSEISQLTASLNGSTVTSYFPGGDKIRLSSKSTYFDTNARFFRSDGTLQMTADVDADFVEVESFDATGKIEVLDQIFTFDRVNVNGVTEMKNLLLYSASQMNHQGQPSAKWVWSLGGSRSLWSYETFNTSTAAFMEPFTERSANSPTNTSTSTSTGVLVIRSQNTSRRSAISISTNLSPPTICKDATSYYSLTDDSLTRTVCVPVDAKATAISIDHTPQENIGPPVVPSEVLVVPNINTGLPIPPLYGR